VMMLTYRNRQLVGRPAIDLHFGAFRDLFPHAIFDIFTRNDKLNFFKSRGISAAKTFYFHFKYRFVTKCFDCRRGKLRRLKS
jgi:hypothetical protein